MANELNINKIWYIKQGQNEQKLQYLETVIKQQQVALREAVPSHAGPLSGPLFKQWNLLLSFV